MSLDIIFLADQPHHAKELARLHDAEWGHLPPRIPVEERAQLLTDASGRGEIPTIFIAVDGPMLVGSSALVMQDMSDRPDLSPWLAAVYVRADRRRQGIASKLVARVEQAAAALGVERFYLYTELEEKFYAKRGWNLLERREYRGVPISVMAKEMAENLPG